MKTKAGFWASFLGGLILLAALPQIARAQSCSGIYLVEQKFPVVGTEQTRWRICWQAPASRGLVITAAFFRKSPTSPWVRVFWDARVAEIFVPYHSGSPRYYDLSGFSFNLTTVGSTDCPAAQGGTPLGFPARVCKQVHDRGLMWKDDAAARRGEEVVLWGAVDAGNYNYLIEWSFQDEGTVVGRIGATGVNLPGKPREAHMHNAIWRLDVDLNGFWGDSVSRTVHTENLPGNTATDTEAAIPTETGLVWTPTEFTGLMIHDATLTNANRSPTGYLLQPFRWGAARHNESFTKYDLWVTRYNGTELRADLPVYVNGQSVSNADIVVWYMGSLHHKVRDEDGTIINGVWQGEAHVMWTGFVLKPHNLFDKTPFFR